MADFKPFMIYLVNFVDRCYCQSDCGRSYNHIYFGRCYCHCYVGWCYYPLIDEVIYVNHIADVIANDLIMVHVEPLFGSVCVMADVIAIVADVIATVLQIELYCNGS